MKAFSRVKPWRRIHSLNGFSESDAKRIYREAEKRHPLTIYWAGLFGLVLSAVIALLAFAFILGFAYSIIDPFDLGQRLRTSILWSIAIVIPVVSGAKVFARLRYSTYCNLVEREMKPKRVNISKCESCGYCLDGLPEDENILLCPECAHETSTAWYSILDDLGIERVHEDAIVSPSSGGSPCADTTGSTPNRAHTESVDADAEES